MPKAGDEFDSFFFDRRSSNPSGTMTTYRYRENGRTVDPVKIVTRRVERVEILFSEDPWQPDRWHYHYGAEDVWHNPDIKR